MLDLATFELNLIIIKSFQVKQIVSLYYCNNVFRSLVDAKICFISLFKPEKTRSFYLTCSNQDQIVLNQENVAFFRFGFAKHIHRIAKPVD